MPITKRKSYHNRKVTPYANMATNLIRTISNLAQTRNVLRAVSGNDTSTRFVNMGDRGSATKVKYGRNKKKMTKEQRAKRKSGKKFKRKVRRALMKKSPISFLTESTTGSMSITGDTGGINGGDLKTNSQLIIGHDQAFGINMGDGWTQAGAGPGNTVESAFINRELGDYNVRINGIDVPMSTSDRVETFNHYVKRRYNKLTIRNDSDTRDLIFDLYECLAACDIADAPFASPASAWKQIQAQYSSTSTGTAPVPYLKGVEPTDFPRFGKYWKVIAKHKVRIPCDGTEQGVNAYQTFKMSGNKYMHRGIRNNSLFAVKGQTKFWMMVIDPEKFGIRYDTLFKTASIWFHRNTHFYPLNDGQHANVNVNILSVNHPTPIQ